MKKWLDEKIEVARLKYIIDILSMIYVSAIFTAIILFALQKYGVIQCLTK